MSLSEEQIQKLTSAVKNRQHVEFTDPVDYGNKERILHERKLEIRTLDMEHLSKMELENRRY